MGSYIYTVRAVNKNITVRTTGEKVNVRLAKYACRNSCIDDHTALLERSEIFYDRAGIAEYIVLGDDMKDLYGMQVFNYGSERGVFNDEYCLGVQYKAIGIILGNAPRSWYIETDKRVIENLHRQNEYRAMKEGKLFIGEFGSDVDAYEEYLYQEDKKAKAEGKEIYFRGYII